MQNQRARSIIIVFFRLSFVAPPAAITHPSDRSTSVTIINNNVPFNSEKRHDRYYPGIVYGAGRAIQRSMGDGKPVDPFPTFSKLASVKRLSSVKSPVRRRRRRTNFEIGLLWTRSFPNVLFVWVRRTVRFDFDESFLLNWTNWKWVEKNLRVFDIWDI